MKKNYWWFMVVIVFVAGLMTSNMLVQAEEDTPVIEWEYKTVKINYMARKNVERSKRHLKQEYLIGKTQTKAKILASDLSILNEHGKEGWELCGVNDINYYFKREIRE
jgi:hypothetical protein